MSAVQDSHESFAWFSSVQSCVSDVFLIVQNAVEGDVANVVVETTEWLEKCRVKQSSIHICIFQERIRVYVHYSWFVDLCTV